MKGPVVVAARPPCNARPPLQGVFLTSLPSPVRVCLSLTITTAYYRGAMGILLVYDVCDEKTFASKCLWLVLVRCAPLFRDTATRAASP